MSVFFKNIQIKKTDNQNLQIACLFLMFDGHRFTGKISMFCKQHLIEQNKAIEKTKTNNYIRQTKV